MNRDKVFLAPRCGPLMLDIALYNPRQHRQFHHSEGPLVLARAGHDQPLWMPVDQTRAGQADALVEIIADEKGIALAMAGCERECHCGRECDLVGHCHLKVPVRFTIGDTQFEISEVARRPRTPARPLERLEPTGRDQTWPVPSESFQQQNAGPSPTTISRWFAALKSLNRWGTSLQEMFVQGALCAVDAIGLDGAIVLRRRDGEWEIAASHLPRPHLGIHCDLEVLDQLFESPHTLFHGNGSGNEGRETDDDCLVLPEEPEPPCPPSSNENHLPPAVVVSPLRNTAGEVVGALYGYRSIRPGNARRGIRYLEAHLIDLLAGAISDGMARLEREAEVERRRVLVEQAFFGTLEQNPMRILSERREVTLLFADLRGFTELARSLASEEVYELLGHVMDCFTAAVMEHDGLVIDYYGDGLAAMWNAPADQADHPELACRAALRMIDALPDVAADWASILNGARLRLGSGVHTGIVQVGNAGSRRRMKYGPRGVNVHLASRIEAATKPLNLPLVITGPTAARLSKRFTTFRLCRTQLPGIEEPIDLYGALTTERSMQQSEVLESYGRALQLFEQDDLEGAARVLANMDDDNESVPTRFLAAHVQRELSRQNRRCTDRQTSSSRGVIPLNVK